MIIIIYYAVFLVLNKDKLIPIAIINPILKIL